MVKIDWSQETGFYVADAGNFDKPLITIEECLIGGILNGFISKSKNSTFLIDVYEVCHRETVQATEPGFNGLVKALNGKDWGYSDTDPGDECYIVE